MLEKHPEVEAVVIATPLVSHAPIAIDCLKAGKHVLCEKLMARTIGQCKEMIKAADDNDRILAIGHQRHYSMLYAHAVEVAQHRSARRHSSTSGPSGTATTPGPMLDDDGKPRVDPDDRQSLRCATAGTRQSRRRRSRWPTSRSSKYGYKSVVELVRWRLFNRTGGGLMAELGSHQLDACCIFLGKVHPLAVTGVGTHSLYGFEPGDGKPNPREVDDHVFCYVRVPRSAIIHRGRTRAATRTTS